MSDTVKFNPRTGEVAISRADGWHVYSPTLYKLNLATGQLAVPDAQAKGWELHSVPSSELNTIYAAKQAAPLATLGGSAGTSAPDLTESTLRGGQQGVTLGTSDEISGATGALLNAVGPYHRQYAVDPAHPVTGGMSDSFGAAYKNFAGQERDANAAAKANNPKAYKGAFLAGSMVPAMAVNPATIGGTAATAGAQGTIEGAGLSDSNSLSQTLKSAAIGGTVAAVLGAGFRGIFNAALNNNSASGLAYRTIQATSPDEPMSSIVQRLVRAGVAPAEVDAIMADVLKSSAARNPAAAVAAIPVARSQMQRANNVAEQGINNMVSPENAALLQQRIVADAQAANGPAYAAAHASPVRVGLTPAVTQRQSFQYALVPAQAAAGDELPPRVIDPTNLGARDIDLIDRQLQGAQRAAVESHGDTSQQARVAQALIPTRGQVANEVRTVADQAFPELATARAGAAHAFSLEQALDAGKTALMPGREAIDVATEFHALPSPAHQAAYLASVATKLRAMLASKGAQANVSVLFDKAHIADKLESLGFPRDMIDQIVEGGAGARRVLDALQGGSDTARKLMAAKAGEAGISQLRPADLIAGSVMGADPVTKGAISVALPMIRATGANAERGSAGQLIQALTSPGGLPLLSLYNRAPQRWGGLLTGAPGTIGGTGASMMAQALNPYFASQNVDPRIAEIARQLMN